MHLHHSCVPAFSGSQPLFKYIFSKMKFLKYLHDETKSPFWIYFFFSPWTFPHQAQISEILPSSSKQKIHLQVWFDWELMLHCGICQGKFFRHSYVFCFHNGLKVERVKMKKGLPGLQSCRDLQKGNKSHFQ